MASECVQQASRAAMHHTGSRTLESPAAALAQLMGPAQHLTCCCLPCTTSWPIHTHQTDVDRLQTMYVRYKCMPEAQVTQAGWDLATSQRYADQLAAEENQAYLREESLLYNGVAPVSIALHIVDAPAEFAVPVKQDRWGSGWQRVCGRLGRGCREGACRTLAPGKARVPTAPARQPAATPLTPSPASATLSGACPCTQAPHAQLQGPRGGGLQEPLLLPPHPQSLCHHTAGEGQRARVGAR